MKSIFLFLFLFITTLTVSAQDDNYCTGKCNHAVSSVTNRVQYYQYESMNKYDLKYLKLDLNAETGSRAISGNALTVSKVVSPLDTFITELRDNMIVDSLFINGTRKSFTRNIDHIFVPLFPALSTGQTFSALIYYHGTANSSGVYSGTIASNGLNYTATLSESYQAREWFPIKQFLQDKIDSTEIWVTTSSINRVGSNGLLQGIDALPLGKVRYRWKTNYPMNYYLPAISVGNYMEYLNYAKPASISPDSILIQHYLVNNTSYFNSAKANLDKTPAFIEKFSELYGLYPFRNEKYGHTMAPVGGMEHQTMSTMSGFGASLIAHELGHQWWGDNVTCAKWNDIWLNEGFATYSECLMMEKLPSLFNGITISSYMNDIHNSVMSLPDGSVYITDDQVYNEGRIFSGRLSYNKGAAIIHNLRFEMQNDSLFFQTLKNYQQIYKDSVAVGMDFKSVAENVCHRSFTDFFNQWYFGQGYPTFNITYFRPNTDSVYLLVNETVSAPTATPFFKGYLQLTINSNQGDTTVLVNLAENNQIFRFACSKTPTNITVDPNNWMINKTGIIASGTVVPVKIIALKSAVNKNCTIDFSWQTTDEMNTEKYQTEVSEDGIHFKTLSDIVAKKAAINDYMWNYNSNGSEVIYFRIKIVQSDGNINYSDVLKFSELCKNVFSIRIKPNPIEEDLFFTVESQLQENAIVSVINSLGQVIKQEIKMMSTGLNSFEIKFTKKPNPGTYLLLIRTESGKMLSEIFLKK